MDSPNDEEGVQKQEKKGTEKKPQEMVPFITLSPPFSDDVLSWDPRK